MHSALNIFIVACLLGMGPWPALSAAADLKPRLLVLTDIGGDPDDQQSMIRLMVFSNEFEIEGLIASASGTPGELGKSVIKPRLIREIVEAYGLVRDNLAQHAEGYPTSDHLLSIIKSGNPQRGLNAIGEGHDTEGSRWIISVVDRPDPRPVNITIWGGQTDLAQALWQVRTQRGTAGLKAFIERIRIYDIYDQDGIANWIWKEFPGLFYVMSKAPEGHDKREAVFRGMYLGGDESLTSREWMETNIRQAHGPLGPLYPTRTWTAPNPHSAVKEGDTPSWFYFLPNGMNNPSFPNWGGWGGRFAKTGDRIYRDAKDTVENVTDARCTVWRWRNAFQRDFQARMDWCVKPPAEANHHPLLVCNGDATRNVLHIQARSGDTIRLSAAGSHDPDAHNLDYRWWYYTEAGTCQEKTAIDRYESSEADVHIPVNASNSEIHVILEVTDDGDPPLTSYRRVVISVDWVDPFICTEGDNGKTFPGAVTPFGLVKLSPDTDKSYHTGSSGYDYAETRIHGFSHIRFGEGCLGSGGNILIKPGIGGFTHDKNKYRETYIKSSEKAAPGYYAVDFESGIRTEFTVSPRVGFHKYTFPASGEASILIDLSRSYAGMMKASLQIENGNEISGYIKSKNICGKQYYKLFYSIKFDKKFDNFKTWNKTWRGSNVSNEETACSGEDIGAWFRFSTSEDEIIQVKVGISPVSIEQAKYERDNEIPGWDFEQVRMKARKAWQDVLGKIEIPVGSREMKTIFYTHLYHSCLDPVIASSSSGTYRAACDEYTIRKTSETAPDYDYYCGWGLWDNFRKFSLLALTEPDIMQNVVRSLVDYYKNRYQGPFTGEFYWPVPSEAQGMEGLHFTAMVIADAYHKGLTDFDIDAAFDGMITDIEYMPDQDVGNALERASLAYAVMKMAKDLGRQKEYEECRAIALSYKDLWNPGQMDNQGNVRGFFTPDRRTVDDVETIGKYCYEGSLWQYRWFVLHDMKGFADLRGGREVLADDLEYFFDHDFYMHINEQDIQAPFLFNYLGKPFLTQKWARAFTTKEVTQLYYNHELYDEPIVKRIYRDDPEGYIRTMDDDYGALSSWFVFSAMGLFPGAPGNPHFLIGSPIFPELRLRLTGDKTFIIKANNVSEENFYIQSAKLNSNSYNKPWIRYTDIVQGGILELEMGPKPNMSWGSEQKDSPPSLSDVVNLSFSDIAIPAGVEGEGGNEAGEHGIAAADITNDGYPDLYVPLISGATDHYHYDLFFRNLQNNTFSEEAGSRGIGDYDGGSHGGCWADLDNDGDYDLINATTIESHDSGAWVPGCNNVFRNNGSGYFTEVTPGSILGRKEETRGLISFDMDNDGDLDLYFVNGWEGSGDPPDERNEVYRNDGNFSFTAFTSGALYTCPAGQGCVDTDWDGDGDIDVIACNKDGDLNMLRNNGGFNNFTLVSPSSIGINHRSYAGVTTGDIDNDGDLDMVLCNGVGNGVDEGYLYRNNGNGTFSYIRTFENADGYMAGFADLDNDGDLDLYMSGDNVVFLNNGSGVFSTGPSVPVSGIHDPRSHAFADIDNDGDMDFMIGVKRSRNYLIRNNNNNTDNKYLKVRLIAPNGQAGAFGAKVRIYPAGQAGGTLLGMREAHSCHGYMGQDDPVLHFGLGSRSAVDVHVAFLNGTTVTRSGVPANSTILINGSGNPDALGAEVTIAIGNDSIEF